MRTARTACERTCIGCRQRDSPGDLLRVVLEQGVVIPDSRAIKQGRGAWLHPACWEVADRRRAFGRALRMSGAPDLTVLRTFVASAQQGSAQQGSAQQSSAQQRSTSDRDREIAPPVDATTRPLFPESRRDGASEDEPPMSAQP